MAILKVMEIEGGSVGNGMEWVDLGMACIGCAAAPLIGALAVPSVFIKFPL